MIDEIRKTLNEFSVESNRVYSYAYATGYYETLLVDLLANASTSKVNEVVRQLDRSISELKAKESK